MGFSNAKLENSGFNLTRNRKFIQNNTTAILPSNSDRRASDPYFGTKVKAWPETSCFIFFLFLPTKMFCFLNYTPFVVDIYVSAVSVIVHDDIHCLYLNAGAASIHT